MRVESWDGRCEAILAYVHNWRCSRIAGDDGLCAQHRRLGCRRPAAWHSAINEHGVNRPLPIPPITKVPAA